MDQKVTCFLPCRQGSERIPEKNVKPFAGRSFGLLEIKLRQLLASTLIDQIVISTNDARIIEYAEALNANRLIVHHRSEKLSASTTSTDDLIEHVCDLIHDGDVLWTHVTSPFITSETYDSIIQCYRHKLDEGHDSLMTTTPQFGFFWQHGKPINYQRSQEKWPRTQTLRPLQEVNSGAFLTSVQIYQTLSDRIGTAPYLYELDKLTGHDIDNQEDFVIAECVAEQGLRKV